MATAASSHTNVKKEFTLLTSPEELAKAADAIRADIPDYDNWDVQQLSDKLDILTGRLIRIDMLEAPNIDMLIPKSFAQYGGHARDVFMRGVMNATTRENDEKGLADTLLRQLVFNAGRDMNLNFKRYDIMGLKLGEPINVHLTQDGAVTRTTAPEVVTFLMAAAMHNAPSGDKSTVVLIPREVIQGIVDQNRDVLPQSLVNRPFSFNVAPKVAYDVGHSIASGYGELVPLVQTPKALSDQQKNAACGIMPLLEQKLYNPEQNVATPPPENVSLPPTDVKQAFNAAHLRFTVGECGDFGMPNIPRVASVQTGSLARN